MSATQRTARVDAAEVARFEAMAAEWWDPDGKFRPLHLMNPLRLDYVVDQVTAESNLLYSQEAEDRVDELMGYSAGWVQHRDNQLAILDHFFGALWPVDSLCFFYAKRIPLSDEARRVLIGVGRVIRVGQPIEYTYSRPGEIQSMLWERSVEHSIRPGFQDGFLLPYAGILALAVDLRGWGETAWVNQRFAWSQDRRALLGADNMLAYVGYMLGSSSVAQRVQDVLGVLRYVRGRPDVDPQRVTLCGQDVRALHGLPKRSWPARNPTSNCPDCLAAAAR